jgi:citrate lyase subunit beta/citryl-CoA lyase
LITPVNVPRFVEKAHLRGADAILLDLEDSVPPSEKDAARGLIKDLIVPVGRGGADVLVRVNNEPSLLQDDLEASVHAGVSAIFVPKIESSDQVLELDARLSELERQRGLEQGAVKLSIHVENPRGLLRLEEMAGASSRIESMSLGTDDYCLAMGIEPSNEGTELFLPLAMLAIVCKVYGLMPMGLLGKVADFSDLAGFRGAAERARQLGAAGAFCIHPGQVGVLNQVFSPSPEKIEWAKRAVAVFEEAMTKGRASTSLDGLMVDTPVYKQALLVLERAKAIAEKESFKAAALARNTPD